MSGNKHEQHLVVLLRDAVAAGDRYLERKVREMQDYSWPPEEEALWDPRFLAAIDDFMDALHDFEPNAQWRQNVDLYDHEDVRRMIGNILAIVTPK